MRPCGTTWTPEQWEERVLNDGSRHQVFKRYFRGQQLAAEVGGQVMLSATERGSSWHAQSLVGATSEDQTPGERWLSAMCETTSSGYELPVDRSANDIGGR